MKMDYTDYQAGLRKDNFYFKAKRELIEILNRYGEVYVIEKNKLAFQLIPSELCREKKLCDIQSIDYPGDFFDLVVAFDVLEHIEDDVRAVIQIHRILKPKGCFIFTVPAFPFLFGSHDRALRHKRRYTKGMLEDLLRGFKEICLGYWNASLFIPVCLL